MDNDEANFNFSQSSTPPPRVRIISFHYFYIQIFTLKRLQLFIQPVFIPPGNRVVGKIRRVRLFYFSIYIYITYSSIANVY